MRCLSPSPFPVKQVRYMNACTVQVVHCGARVRLEDRHSASPTTPTSAYGGGPRTGIEILHGPAGPRDPFSCLDIMGSRCIDDIDVAAQVSKLAHAGAFPQ